jgi:hypothetical protein
MFGWLKLRKLSALQKLYFAMIVIACCLMFYAVGIMTNFFASPIFSMFFIISYETAHNIVSYVALAIAVGFCLTVLATRLVKKRRFVLREPEDKPVVGSGKASSGASVQTTLSAFVEAINPTFPQSNSDNDTTNKQDIILDSEALTCPACKKKFIDPIFVLDYSRLTPRLMRCCPFCDQPIDSEQEAPAEEIFVDSPIGIKIK